MSKTYNASVAYETEDAGKCEYTRKDFEGVYDATEWAFKRVTEIAHNWGEIQPDGGLEVVVNVFTPEGDYCDYYNIVCG